MMLESVPTNYHFCCYEMVKFILINNIMLCWKNAIVYVLLDHISDKWKHLNVCFFKCAGYRQRHLEFLMFYMICWNTSSPICIISRRTCSFGNLGLRWEIKHNIINYIIDYRKRGMQIKTCENINKNKYRTTQAPKYPSTQATNEQKRSISRKNLSKCLNYRSFPIWWMT